MISTAIIGLGKVGLTYDLDSNGHLLPNQVMTHCRAISLSSFFEITCLVDSESRAIDTAMSHYEGSGFKSVQEVAPRQPELVIVSVPTSEQLQVIQAVTNSWDSTIFLIEKPFGNSLIESRKIRDLLLSRNAKVYVNYFRRYLPNFASLKTSSHFQGRGKLLKVTINAYGTLGNIFSHFLDLIIFLESSLILGKVEKTTFLDETDGTRFLDSTSGVQYILKGIGQTPNDCEVSLLYEHVVISIAANGRCVQINSLGGSSLAVFDIDLTTFYSYQSFVVKHIEEDFFLARNNTAMDDAIRIHEFIESV